MDLRVQKRCMVVQFQDLDPLIETEIHPVVTEKYCFGSPWFRFSASPRTQGGKSVSEYSRWLLIVGHNADGGYSRAILELFNSSFHICVNDIYFTKINQHLSSYFCDGLKVVWSSFQPIYSSTISLQFLSVIFIIWQLTYSTNIPVLFNNKILNWIHKCFLWAQLYLISQTCDEKWFEKTTCTTRHLPRGGTNKID